MSLASDLKTFTLSCENSHSMAMDNFELVLIEIYEKACIEDKFVEFYA